MNNPLIKKCSHRIKKSKAWMQLISTLCVIAFFLISCIGCTSDISTDTFDSLKNELTNEIDSLKSDHEAAQEEIDALKNSNQAVQEEIDALKNSNQAAKEQIDALKNSNQAAKEQIDALKNSNQAAKEEIDALKNSNQAAQEEIDALKNSNQAAQEEIDALKNSNQAAQEEIDRLKEKIQDLQNSILPDEPNQKIRIYIDQGHNPTSYHNAGATGNGLYEQDLTFTIGCLLAELLEEDGRFEVCLSRPTADTVLGTDNDSSLDARVQGAQEFGADYFISLHTNSFESESANGIEVFVAEQDTISYAFGNSLLQGLIDSTQLKNRGMKLNPDLRVLKNATMPAALVEMGFISNTGDATLLSENPELFAQGIYDGILAHFALSSHGIDTN